MHSKEFVPVLIDGGIVLNAVNVCTYAGMDCKTCPDLAVAIHNWYVSNGLKYLIVDFQDEKEVCSTILVELMQLRKRLKFPFLLVGLMDKQKEFLRSYAYSGYPFFATPEEAVLYLSQTNPSSMEVELSNIEFDKPLPCSRSRFYRFDLAQDDDDVDQDDMDEMEADY